MAPVVTAGPRMLLVVLLALAPVACHRKPMPTYEYEQRVTTTSADATTTTVPAPPPGKPAQSPPSGWQRQKPW